MYHNLHKATYTECIVFIPGTDFTYWKIDPFVRGKFQPYTLNDVELNLAQFFI